MTNQISSATGTKERILEVASRLFHQQGFEATSVAAILRGAGVNSGSLYHFFPSKKALLAGVVERHLYRLEATILDPIEEVCPDPLERIFKLLELYRTGLRVTGCTQGCPVGNLALEVGNRYPEIQTLLTQYFSRWSERVRAWLEEAGDRLPAELDRARFARYVLSVMEGGVMQARAAGDLTPLDASISELGSHLDLLVRWARDVNGTRADQAARSSTSRQDRRARPENVPVLQALEEERATGSRRTAAERVEHDLPALAEPELSKEVPATVRPGWRTW